MAQSRGRVPSPLAWVGRGVSGSDSGSRGCSEQRLASPPPPQQRLRKRQQREDHGRRHMETTDRQLVFGPVGDLLFVKSQKYLERLGGRLEDSHEHVWEREQELKSY